MYEEILPGFNQKMVRRIEGPTILHICGDITPRLDALKRVGLDCFNFDWAIEPRMMKQKTTGRFKIMGNGNTGDLMRGTTELIERQVLENL